MKKQVAVIGGGTWGTALAQVCADNQHEVTLWMRDEQVAAHINAHHVNQKYLPDVKLSPLITASSDLEATIKGKKAVILVLPSHAIRSVVRQLALFLEPDVLLMHAIKGFELDSLKRISEVICEEVPASIGARLAVLTGPSHAEEVVRRAPTTVVVASRCETSTLAAQDLVMTSYFRVYTNNDLLGAELAGALKNIIALGAGLSDGLGFGDNAKAALLTRGLAEITRLGVKMGANPMTFLGLAGVGDLIVTCTSKHSRNWRAGYMLGQGIPLDEVLKKMGMVVEGVRTTKAAKQLAEREGVEMPITNIIYDILFEQKSPRQGVEELMGRMRTFEMNQIDPT